MTDRGVVALVSPREERQRSARAWAPLLADRAELRVMGSPEDRLARDADFVLVDEKCPSLDAWIARALGEGTRPASIIVFGDDEESARGALPWGEDGAPVLATLSDFLERRALLQEADRFVDDLRESTERLDAQRRRFAGLVLTQAHAMQETHAMLAREVDQLRRLQSLARFFAAPGPADGFADRLASVLAHALGAAGLAIVRRGEPPFVEGSHRLAARAAIAAVAPHAEPAATVRVLPFASLPGWDVVMTFTAAGAASFDAGSAGVRDTLELAAEGFGARLAADDAAARHVRNDRVLRALRGGLLKIDSDGRVQLANPALTAMMNLPAGSLEGRPLADAFASDPHLVELFETFRAGVALGDDVETYMTTANGSTLSVAIRASCVAAEDGEGAAVLALFFDLSRRKEVEAEVRRAERLAALGRLSAGVAHEIRNPLAGIRTTAELLRSRLGPDDDRVRFADVILEESLRLDRIVTSMLQFAKPPEPRLEPVDLAALVDRALQLASGKAAEHRVTLRRLPAERGALPLADRDQILQVLLNLILNAVEATPSGGEVRVGLEGAAGKAGVAVRIEDGGEGVPASIRERVFDPFFTTKPGGTGLGLSISEHIVRRHGGSIRLEKRADGPHAAIMTLGAKPAVATSTRGGVAWPAS